MAEIMTSIRLRNSQAAGPELIDLGRKTPAEMIESYRRTARHMLEKAQAILAAADDDFHVVTWEGSWGKRGLEVRQEGAPKGGGA